MGAINFDKPSEGVVSANDTIALKIRAPGDGTIALQCETEHNRWNDAIAGISKNWVGVHGISNTAHSAVWGEAKGEGGHGIWGEATNDKGGAGVYGKSKNSVGVVGLHGIFEGVTGLESKNTGVVGISSGPVTGPVQGGTGVYGEGLTGVVGKSVLPECVGVSALVTGKGATGVKAQSTNAMGGIGVEARVQGSGGKAIWATASNDSPDSFGIGVMATSYGGQGIGLLGGCERGIGVLGQGKIAGRFVGEIAGRFEGDVEVTGDIKMLYADCAEDFDIVEENIEAGTVMVLKENGSLQASFQEYDKKVAGVVSGASGYKAAIVLDSQGSLNQSKNDEDQNRKDEHRLPIALMGKVYCKVDATNASIEIGDLLTTSSTRGCAMKAEDSTKAFGAVIGKALGTIKEGLGMIPVLVALQ
jgi:hypothetical protein